MAPPLILLLVITTCLLPSRSLAARGVGTTALVVQGRVFCDTCRAGFETPASTYISGAKVRVECRDRNTLVQTCNYEGTTDMSGTYNILVTEEHENELCESVIVSSPQEDCKAAAVPGRERSSVFLNRNNGIASNKRFANSMGFQKDEALPQCAQLLQIYAENEEDV